MKTLAVQYTPRIGSNTKILLDEAIKIAKNVSDVEVLNLVDTPPELLMSDNLNAYIKKRFQKIDIEENEQESLKNIESFAKQVLDKDFIFLAFPIYNFNMPATIKAWIDNILIDGMTFKYTEYGPDGFLKNTKLLVINTSDSTQPFSGRDYSSAYLKEIASFLGIKEIRVKGAFGLRYTGLTQVKLEEFKSEVRDFMKI